MVIGVKKEPASSSSGHNLSKLSDVDYLVARSRLAKSQGDPHGAKAWLISAKLMFPEDPAVHFEAYSLDKADGRACPGAKALAAMAEAFGWSGEPRLATELTMAVAALLKRPEERNEEEQFLADVFEALPAATARTVLLDSAKVAATEGRHTASARRTMLALAKFPYLVAEQGADLLAGAAQAVIATSEATRRTSRSSRTSSLDAAEDIAQLLVEEICPRLLPKAELALDAKLLKQVVHVTLVYCIEYVGGVLSGGDDGKEQIKRRPPWPHVRAYLQEVGRRLRWTLTVGFADDDQDHGEALLQRTQAAMSSGGGHQSGDDCAHEVLTVCIYGILQALAGDRHDDAVLVEAFISHTDGGGASPARGSPASKRRRTTDDERLPILTHGCEPTTCGSSGNRKFLLAVGFFELIQADHRLEACLQPLRGCLSQHLGSFLADVALYQGRFREALHSLRELPQATSEAESCRRHLRLGAVQLCIGDHAASADHALRAAVLSSFATAATPEESRIADQNDVASAVMRFKAPVTGGRGRHIHFLPFFSRPVLAYCCRLLVHVLKDRCLQPATLGGRQGDDSVLGHVIVLLQYIWPEERDLFYLLISRIQSRETFCYPILCDYIFRMEFLEEFSGLLYDSGRKIALDICHAAPQAAVAQTQSRKVATRGANKGEKDEMRSALRSQARRTAHTSLDTVIVSFLTTHRQSVLDCLVNF